jgi:MFS family permease
LSFVLLPGNPKPERHADRRVPDDHAGAHDAERPISGALSDRFGSRVFSMLGMLITRFLWRCWAPQPAPPHAFHLPSGDQPSSRGLGSGFFVVPNNSAIMARPPAPAGVASGVLATFRYLGMIAGTTVGGSLFDMIEKLLKAGGAGESTAFRSPLLSPWGRVLFASWAFYAHPPCLKRRKPSKSALIIKNGGPSGRKARRFTVESTIRIGALRPSPPAHRPVPQILKQYSFFRPFFSSPRYPE